MPEHNFRAIEGRLETVAWESDLLRANRVGDPAERRVIVQLPAGYDTSDADYPLVVELAAYTSSGPKRLGWQAFGESLPQRIERLIASEAIPPVVTAYPDAFTSLGGNQYVDSLALGRWATWLHTELVDRLEDRFRIRRGPKHRGLIGKSSGGYGAWVQGLRFGDRWGAIVSHSGDVGFDWVYRPDLPGALDALAPFGGSFERFYDSILRADKIRGSQFHRLMTFAMAASYDPDPDAPFGVRLPVDPHTCELDPERWSAWLAHDPLTMVDDSECRARLSDLRLLFFDCGSRDPYRLHYGARALARKLDAYGIAHLYEEFDDDHSGLDYRYDRSLPLLCKEIDRR